jgi:two-component system response regulator GlrR
VEFSPASTPEILHSRELFGAHERGESLLSGGHFGAVERASTGTLLITEIDELNPATREGLTRAIATGLYHRENEPTGRVLAARIIATSTSATPGLGPTAQSIEIPALRERREDILPLAVHFLSEFADEQGIQPVGFTREARECLLDEPWNGNVRELRERVRQAVRLSADGSISVESLVLAMDGDAVPSFKDAKRAFEARYVRGLLRRCGGNISRAARLAKKDRKDFYDVIRRTGIDPSEFRD